MKRLYIAYGSNLNVRQMKTRCPNAKILGTEKLKDWELLLKVVSQVRTSRLRKRKTALCLGNLGGR